MNKDISSINNANQIIPNIKIACVIIRFVNNKLEVLLQQHFEQNSFTQDVWGLPYNFVKVEETTMDSVQRLLKGKNNFEIGFLDQFRTFEELNSTSKQIGFTIAYCAFVRQKDNVMDESFLDSCKWYLLDELPNLLSTQKEILNFSLKYLKTLIKYEPIVFNLLPQKFTLLELICLYEQFLSVELDKSNFRRKILSMNLLVPLNEKQQDVSHRAAKYYEFDSNRCKIKKGNEFSLDF
jgi:8-oxo-dGTP diphosphatase